jgi:2-methylcitrate dehydratase PrpD
MTLTRKLVTLIRSRPISDEDRETAALFVLDTLACAIGGRDTEPARMLGAVMPSGSPDLGRRAFHLGGLAHILEMDDLHRDSVTHPGCVVIPAAWALAAAGDMNGRAFLDAVVAGYEACCRVGMSVGREHYRIWHNTSTCGPFGSAMAAAQLLTVSDEEAVWALGNAGTQSCGLWQFLESGAMSKHLHTARAAEAGLLAAVLAAKGFTGAPDILEGQKGFYAGFCTDPLPEAVTAAPEGPWALTRTSIKPWPCCRHTHPAIDAALELHGALAGAQPVRVQIGAYRAALDVCDRPRPNDPYGAKFSLQHCVAAALREGEIGLDSFDASARERLAPYRTMVSLSLADDIDTAYPRSWGTEVTVTTANGQTLSARRRDAKGDPDNPVTAEELAAKAKALMISGGLAEIEADRTIAAILDLPGDRAVKDVGYVVPEPGATETSAIMARSA